MSFLTIVSWLLIPKNSYACAVCFGATDLPSRMALSGAIVTLLGALLIVLSGFIAFFLNLKQRTKKMIQFEGNG